MRGYQSDDDDWSEQSTEATEGRSSSPIAVGVIFIVLFTFFDGVVWVFNGGGFISLIRGLVSVHAHSASVDVDENGLSVIAVLFLGLLWIGVCRLLDIKSISHRRSALLVLGLVAAMLAFDLGPENRLIAGYMAAHGYRHCVSRDHTVGAGKGEVWFDNYVRSSVACPVVG